MKCKQEWPFDEMGGDHITPWRVHGATILTNLKSCVRTVIIAWARRNLQNRDIPESLVRQFLGK